MKRLFLIFLFLLIACPAWSATKTVCGSGCDYTTLYSALSGYNFEPDDVLEIRADTIGGTKTYYDTNVTISSSDSGTSGHPVTIQGRTGDTIILSGGYDTTGWDSGWTDVGANVYSRGSITTEVKVALYGTTLLTKNTSTPTTPSLNQYGWASNVLYVNVGGDPSSTTLWKAGKNNYPILIQGDYLTFKNIKIDTPNYSAFYVDGQTGIILDNIEASNGAIDGVYLYTCVDCEVKNSQIHDFKIGGNGITVKGGSNILISKNVIYDIGAYGSGNYNGIATSMITHSTLLKIDNNTIYDINGFGVSVYDSGVEITNNLIYSCGLYNTDGTIKKYGFGSGGGGVYISGGTSNSMTMNNFVYDTSSGISINTTSGTGNNRIFYNTVINSIVNGIGDYYDGNPTNRNLFYNNTVYHNPSADNNPAYTGHGFHLQDVSGYGGGKAAFVNNVCYNAVSSAASHCLFINDTGTLNSVYLDNNIWYAVAGGVNARVFGTSYTDLAAYKTAIQSNEHSFGIDGIQANTESNTLFSDPLFISATNYHLQSGSPARGAGVNVGLSNTNPPDIGAEPYKQYVPWR